MLRSGGGRAGVDRLDDAGAGCHSEFVRRQDSLPRLQGLRKRLAKASHVCRDARRLGLRHQTENARSCRRSTARTGIQSSIRDDDFYYLSEQSGSFNVYKSMSAIPLKSVAVTRFTTKVRFLTRAKNGTLAFSYDGELYTMARAAEEGRGQDRRRRPQRDRAILPVSAGMTEASSPRTGRNSHSCSGEKSSSAASTGNS